MEFKPKKISLLLMSLLAASSPFVFDSAWAADGSPARVLTAARMRSGPALDKDVLVVMSKGEVIHVLGQDGKWSKVRRLHSGKSSEGWVRSDLIASIEATTANNPKVVQAAEVSAELLAPARLRNEASETSNILAVMQKGEIVRVVSQSGNWTKIQRTRKVLDREGWVRSDLIRLAGGAKTNVAPASVPDAPRYLVQVIAPTVPVFEKPDLSTPIIAVIEQSVELESDLRQGEWYRVKRFGGGEAWVLNSPTTTGNALEIRAFPQDRRIAFEVGQKDPRRAESLSKEQLAARTAEQEKEKEVAVDRVRPQGAPIEPRLPVIDPSQVEPPSPLIARQEVPIRDRWRLVKALGLLPYNILDPYNPNVIKGDLPVLQDVLGDDWFFNFTGISDTLLEARRLPTPTGPQNSPPGTNSTLGRGQQYTFAQTAILNFALIKGNTTFKPPDYEFRFVPVFNYNYTHTQEQRAVNINPSRGVDRNDGFVGVQELFIDKHLRNVSERYDFDSLRVGIQPFTADFRGFLFIDQPFGVRLFGTRDNNLFQYNLAWFRRLEKDTNSGLNDIGRRLRNDDIFVFNLYNQDKPRLGFTTQAIVLHNRNREDKRQDFFNNNGFLERPAVFGSGRRYNYDVTYFGVNGDGHFGRLNLTASAYYATGKVRNGQLSQRKEDIGAYFGAIEASHDFDWIRLRASALYASGDRDPFDNKAGGFDSVLENPLFAGADTSYFIRQAVPLIDGGAVALSMRNGLLANLRTSREHGQSNFTNPGLHLFGIGADFDVTPRLRVIANANYLEFDNLSSLAVLRQQRLNSTRIGYDFSVGIQYRPYFSQNVVLNASIATLQPARGLRELYGNAVDSRQYSGLINLVLTF